VAGFRRLNRARIQLFRGDDHAMKESRIQLRAQMEANRSVPTSGPVFEELVKGLDEAAQMLGHEIVRGDLNQDTGRYGRFLLFVLRIFCSCCEVMSCHVMSCICHCELCKTTFENESQALCMALHSDAVCYRKKANKLAEIVVQ
jgi:hypothetical protein